MAVVGGYFESWTLRTIQMQLGLAAAPGAGGFYILLHDDPTVLADATMADVVAGELLEVGGYERYHYEILLEDLSFDALTNRAIAPLRQWTISASGQSLQWAGVVLCANASPNSNAVATADVGTDTITVAAHGLTNGEAVLFTSPGSVFGGLVAGQIYFAANTTTNTLQLEEAVGGGIVALTSTGAGEVRLRYAKGEIVAGFTYDSLQTIFDGASQTFEWSSQAMFNSLALAGNGWG